MTTLRFNTIALCTGCALAAPAAAETDSPTPVIDRMQQQIDELQSEVARLKRQSGEGWLTEQRAGEIRALVEDVLADADTRASLLQEGLTSGWEEGFFLRSADGNYRVNVNGQMQFRFMLNHQESSPEDDDRWGFENTRTKLWLTGNVVSPDWVYKVEINFDRDGGGAFLEDAYVGYVFEDTGFVALAGQFKVPMLREELIFSAQQQAVERSLVNEEFTAGRTQGVALDYRDERMHFTGGWTDGHPASGGFNMPALDADTDISLTGRGEVLLAGDWAQFDDLPSWRGEDAGFLLGGAVHWQKGESGTAADELEVFQWTVDASAEFGGANLFTYFVGRNLSGAADADQYGFVLQGGFFVNDDWEVFGRYEWADDDLSSEDLNVITVGATRYFARHRLKWTTDIGVGLDEVVGTFGDGQLGNGGDIAGWRTDAAGEDGQVVIRSQLQLLF